MKICKFCKKGVKSVLLKKRVIKLPTGLPITSVDSMCDSCYNKLKKSYGEPNNLSGNTDLEQVEGTDSSTPVAEGRQLEVQPIQEQ